MTVLRMPLRRIFSAAVLLCLCLTPSALAAPPGTIIWGYQEGLAKAQSPDGAFGYANVRGEVVIPMQYTSVLDFSLGTTYLHVSVGTNLSWKVSAKFTHLDNSEMCYTTRQ